LAHLLINEEVEKKFPPVRKARISVFGAVRKMREQRWNMVKKHVQYSFIYEYLEHWLVKNNFDYLIQQK